MIKTAVIGASGYAGAELVRLLSRHRDADLRRLFVSENSADLHRGISDLYGSLCGVCSLPLEGMSPDAARGLSKSDLDAVFLATEHKVSHDLAPIFIKNGICVIDLSGAFRLSDPEQIRKHYGFAPEKEQLALLESRVYALTDLVSSDKIRGADLLSMPGCYTTCSELALLPLVEEDLLDLSMPPVINAVSGVSGAGRKAGLTNSFCEVSLNSYGLFTHRHRPEIEEYAKCKVLFNPHLGSFKRGILATISARLRRGVSEDLLCAAYEKAYGSEDSFVRFRRSLVKLQDVQFTPYCDIAFSTDGEYVVITSALDNLLKGAASQAVEAFNIRFGLPRGAGIV